MYVATWSVFNSKLLLYFQKMELLYLGKWNIEAQARKKTN